MERDAYCEMDTAGGNSPRVVYVVNVVVKNTSSFMRRGGLLGCFFTPHQSRVSRQPPSKLPKLCSAPAAISYSNRPEKNKRSCQNNGSTARPISQFCALPAQRAASLLASDKKALQLRHLPAFITPLSPSSSTKRRRLEAGYVHENRPQRRR